MESNVAPSSPTQIKAATNMLMLALQQGGVGHPNDPLGNTLMMLMKRGLLPSVMYQLRSQNPSIYEALKATPVMQAVAGPNGGPDNGKVMQDLIQNMPQELVTGNRRTGEPKVYVQGFPRNPRDVGVE